MVYQNLEYAKDVNCFFFSVSLNTFLICRKISQYISLAVSGDIIQPVKKSLDINSSPVVNPKIVYIDRDCAVYIEFVQRVFERC